MPQRELTPADYILMLRRRWVLIVVLTLVGGPLAYGVSRFLPNRYKSQTMVLVEQPTVPVDIVRPVDTTDISQRLSTMKQEILSRSRLEPIIQQFGLYSNQVSTVPMEDLVGRLQQAIDVAPMMPMAETRATQLPGFSVTVTMDTARTAQQVCTAVTSLFIAESLRTRQRHSEDTTQFLAQQLDDAKKKLDDQDSKLAAFKRQYLGSLPDQEQTNLNILMTLNSALDATTQSITRAEQDKTFADSMLNQQIEAWKESQSGHNPQTLEQRLAQLQAELEALQAKYTDVYPDVIKKKEEIAETQKNIAQNAQNKAGEKSDDKQNAPSEPLQVTQLRAQIHGLDQLIAEKTKEQEKVKQQIAVYQGRVQSSPAIEQQFTELTRDYHTASDFYNDLLKRRDQAAMATNLERQQEGEQFVVLDPANLPDKPSFPNRPLFLLGGFAGGMALGLGLALFLEMKDSSLRTEQDVEILLHLPVLALIPARIPSGKRLTQQLALEPGTNIEIGQRS